MGGGIRVISERTREADKGTYQLIVKDCWDFLVVHGGSRVDVDELYEEGGKRHQLGQDKEAAKRETHPPRGRMTVTTIRL